MATGCADPNPHQLYHPGQIRTIEHAALALRPQPPLMQRAGQAIARLALTLLAKAPAPRRVAIIAGPGNNGGDGLEAGTVLSSRGVEVVICLASEPARMSEDARAALARARAAGVRFEETPALTSVNLVIDALFGIGLSKPLSDRFRALALQINQLDCPVLAVDVPSGLDAGSGAIMGTDGVAVQATHTLTFIADKPGLHTFHGRDCAGEVTVDDLGIDPALLRAAGAPAALLNAPSHFVHALVPRKHASHKGSFGDLTVVGGAAGMSGAVILAARMGAMAGAGRAFAAFAGPAPAFDPLHPELMCREAQSVAMDRGAVVIGPGLGLSRDAVDLLARALSAPLPLVIDADALNLVAAEPSLAQRLRQRTSSSLITPHPLEAARLLSTSVADVQADRRGAAALLAQRFNGIVVLKGSGSVIASPVGDVMINPTGNAALSTAGSGDVLAGLCGGLLAQGWPVWETALAATWLHGRAAELLVSEGIGPAGVTASELPAFVRHALNHLAATRAHKG